MNKRIWIIILINLLVTFGFMIPAYSANLKLEITASTFENSGLNHLKVDYKIGSATDIILKPFSYGWIPTSGWEGSALVFEPHNTLHFCVNEKGCIYPNDLIYLGAKKAI